MKISIRVQMFKSCCLSLRNLFVWRIRWWSIVFSGSVEWWSWVHFRISWSTVGFQHLVNL